MKGNSCYKIDTLTYKSGLLDNVVNAVYVLLMEGSDRKSNVYRQIEDYKLSTHNHIIINKGYKKCPKTLCAQKPRYDLMNANIYVMKDAEKNGYNNILILEDDFILDERIRQPSVIKDLETFTSNNEFDIYNLGCVCPIMNFWRSSGKHIKMTWRGTTHADIISKNGRQNILKNFNKDPCMKNKISHFQGFHDVWYNYVLNKQYMYYRPLCYQTFPETENKSEWSHWFIDLFLRILGLNKKEKPGWDILYVLTYLLSIVLNLFPLLFIILAYILLRSFYGTPKILTNRA
tara:strand:+ start:14335 stop:15201 length:867 start_codon:yes stop_codon:yes gene_type:complete